jgi:hypothetical protein
MTQTCPRCGGPVFVGRTVRWCLRCTWTEPI